MSRSIPPLRNRYSSLRAPLIVAVACVALTIPGTAAARSQTVHQEAAPASNVVAAPKLTVLYPNDADVKYFADMSANGAHLYLGSATDLVNDGGATESSQPWDVIPYTATRIFSPVQPGFIGLTHVSPDGRSSIVYTANELTGTTDPGSDLYLIKDGVTKLASAGTASENQIAQWLADDGSRMIFRSDDAIAGTGDSNGVPDLYEYTASTDKVTLLNPDIPNAVFLRASPDGKHVLVVDFNGDGTSGYEYIGTTSTLRSAGTLAGFSADSSKVYFTTSQDLVAGDTDGLLDGYYSDSAGGMHLMDLNLDPLTGTDAPKTLRLSPDGTHWLLSTDASLVAGDTNGTTDWYVGDAAGWTLIPGGLGTTSQLLTTANDSVIVWASADPAVAGDTDGTTDIYRWSAANPDTTEILTDGSVTGTPTTIRALSSDGSRVIFSTNEDLDAADGDSASDLYRWEGGTNTLLTPGSAADVTFKAASTDGRRVAFSSVDQLVAEDTNSIENVYLSDEDTTAPTATISALPNGSGATADLTLGSTDSSALFFTCKLDDNPQACGASTHLTGLAAGSHTLDVTAYDAAWNTSSVVSRTWTVDLTKPTATAPTWIYRTGVSLSSNRPTIKLSWTGADTGGSGVGSYDVEQSTDSGAYARIATAIASPTFDRLVYGGHVYRFRVRSNDKAGNAGDWVFGSAFKLNAISQTSSGVTYGPTTSRWHSATSTVYWGGTAKYATTASSTVTYSFTGRSFAWVSLKASTRGKANIYVNGVLKATVELKSTSTLKQAVVWQTTFTTSAKRTVMIKVLGTSGRPRVDVDGFFYGS